MKSYFELKREASGMGMKYERYAMLVPVVIILYFLGSFGYKCLTVKSAQEEKIELALSTAKRIGDGIARYQSESGEDFYDGAISVEHFLDKCEDTGVISREEALQSGLSISLLTKSGALKHLFSKAVKPKVAYVIDGKTYIVIYADGARELVRL